MLEPAEKGRTVMTIPAHYLDEAKKAIARTQGVSRRGFDSKKDDPPDVLCVATALAFLDCGPVVQVALSNRHAKSSYGLKHDAERWGRLLGFEPYIANGDLICAVLYRGIPYRHIRGPNCTVALRLAESLVGNAQSFVRFGVFQSHRTRR